MSYDFFFFNDTATTEIYTLSLHDALPISLLLDREGHVTETAAANVLLVRGGVVLSPPRHSVLEGVSLRVVTELCAALKIPFEDRKSTRLNSSHANISYAVFCLKKKKNSSK